MKCPTFFALSFLMLAVGISADDREIRRELRSCMSRQLRADNQVAADAYRLNSNELHKLENLISDEINVINPLHNYNDERQHASIRNIQNAGQKSLPTVSTKKLGEILFKLKATSEHCVIDLHLNTPL